MYYLRKFQQTERHLIHSFVISLPTAFIPLIFTRSNIMFCPFFCPKMPFHSGHINLFEGASSGPLLQSKYEIFEWHRSKNRHQIDFLAHPKILLRKFPTQRIPKLMNVKIKKETFHNNPYPHHQVTFLKKWAY